MSDASVHAESKRVDGAVSTATAATIVAYTVLGTALLLTRLTYLGHSFWHDEIHTVADVIRRGPGEIFAGPELNHALYCIVAWAGRYVIGDSETAYRVWSAVPFVIGVSLVTVWLHVRQRALAGILFLFLATVSPLLLDITRQARGYGLAFFAMGLMMVAALEADRHPRTWVVGAFCVGGVLGTWTLPQFGIAFVATGVVLLRDRDVRRRLGVGLALSLIAIAAWYVPHAAQLQAVSQDSGRVQIHTAWLATAPIDQIVIPALVWIDAIALIPGLVWLPVVLALVVLMASSPLARDRRQLLLLTAGTVATIAILWLAQTYVLPRYLSFLLVPLFILLATGAASVLGRLRTRPAIVRTLVAVTMLALLVASFARTAPDVVRLPREAHKEAAEVVEREALAASPVLVYAHHPEDLDFYLDRPVQPLRPENVVARVCAASEAVVYVVQPFVVPGVSVPCLRRAGVRHYRVRQYTRGDQIDVWVVPPAS